MTMQTDYFFVPGAPPPRSEDNEPAATEALIERLEPVPTRVLRDGDTFFVVYEYNADADPAAVRKLRQDVETQLTRIGIRYEGEPVGEVWRESGEVLQLPAAPPPLSQREQYDAAGWVLLPLDGKRCTLTGWTSLTKTPDCDWRGKNVGVLLGEPSGNLGDVDLDGLHTPQLGDVLFGHLPSSGRQSKPYSHRWFRFTDTCKTVQLSLTKAQAEQLGLASDDTGKAMLVELRGKGGQTMVPRSRHPSGEYVEWHGEFPEKLPDIPHEEALARCELLAALAVIALRWPEQGTRDETAMALAGTLLTAAEARGLEWLTPELIDALAIRVAECAGDEEARDRGKAHQTLAKRESGEEVTALTRLLELCDLTGPIKRKLAAWFYGGQSKGAPAPEGMICVIEGKGQLVRVVEEAEAALLGSDEPIFQRGRNLVRVAYLPQLGHGINIPPDTTGLVDCDVPWTRKSLNRVAEFGAYSVMAKKWVPINPPKDVAGILLRSAGEWRFPVLRGIAGTPIVLPDGNVITEPGFDATTGIWLDTGGAAYPTIGTTEAEAAAALAKLKEPFAAYRWAKDNPGVSIVLSAILCMVGRNLIPYAPFHGFDAVYPGSGKSLLMIAACIIGTGQQAPSVVMTRSAEENQKRIETALMRGVQVLCLDNVTVELGGELLCQVVTHPSIEVRRLGANESVTIPNTTTLLATGNGMRLYGDFSRRGLIARIDPGRPDPENVKFDFSPDRLAAERRPEYVAAALTILRWWITSGMQGAPPPVGSFEDWSTVVRGALIALGEKDPYISMQRVKRDDPEKELYGAVIEKWLQVFGDRKVSMAEVGETRYGDSDHESLVGRVVTLTDLERWETRRVGQRLRPWVERLVPLGEGRRGRLLSGFDETLRKNVWWVEESRDQGELIEAYTDQR